MNDAPPPSTSMFSSWLAGPSSSINSQDDGTTIRDHRNNRNTNLSRKRAYRGFNSSISALFQDERVTCSSVACFGVLASMKTEYLLRQAHPVRGTARRERPRSIVVSIALLVTICLFSLTYVLLPNNGYSSRVKNSNFIHNFKPQSKIHNDGSVLSYEQHRALRRVSITYRVLENYDNYNYDDNDAADRQDDDWYTYYEDNQDANQYGNQNYNDGNNYRNNYNDNGDYTDSDSDGESTFENSLNSMSLGQKVRTFLVLGFLVLFGIIGRRRRSRTRYFMIKAKLYDDRLYGRDLPAVALSNSRSSVSDHASTLSPSLTQDNQDALSVASASAGVSITREDYKKLQKEIERCEEGKFEASQAHSLCGCYPTDTYAAERRNRAGKIDAVFDERTLESRYQGDNCCVFVQRIFSAICCGAMCNLWIQVFGICALAQEARETKQLVPRLAQRIDYLTHEPFSSYEGKLQALRRSHNGSFFRHAMAISLLSQYIIGSFLISVLMVILTVFLTVENFGLANATVLIATFAQSFLVLYFVHWLFCRFHLSLDAVIKLFAAGFILAVPTAYAVEGIIQVCVLIGAYIMYGILKLMDLHTFFEKNIYVGVIIGELINAFLVAAVTEELTKYLVYRCILHPDLMVDEDWLDDNDEIAAADIETASRHKHQSIAADARDYCGRAACITIAMVCTAVGLACAENVVYVYLAGGTRVEEEIVILLARSIFPIHALCAAIQSIGVIRRDVEGDDSMHLGRITLPAILLHGFFDAILMIMGVLEEIGYSNGSNTASFFFDSLAWVIIVVIIATGVVWYYRENRDQKERLLDMQKKQEFHEASERGYVGGML